MSEQQKQELVNLARGSWQREVINDLIRYGWISNPVSFLRGRAKNYSIRYETSFWSLLSRVEKAGYKIEVRRGPRGGWYGATFKLVAE